MGNSTVSYIIPRETVTLDRGGIMLRRGSCELVEKGGEVELKNKRGWTKPEECINNRPHPCSTADTMLDKICELVAGQTSILACLEIIKNNPIAAFDGDALQLNKCSPDGNPLVFYAITDESTGNLTGFETYVLIDGELVPYEGTECVDCNKQYRPVDLWVADPESPFCDYRVYECDGEKFIYNPNPPICDYEKIPMGTITTPYKPTGEDVCDDAQTGPINLPAGATTVADIIAANLEGLTFDFNGTEVPVTADDIESIKITPKPCGALDPDGVKVTADWVVVNEVNASNYIDVPEGGVDGTVAIEVPEGGCSIAELCFKKCLSKQEIAALGGKEG